MKSVLIAAAALSASTLLAAPALAAPPHAPAVASATKDHGFGRRAHRGSGFADRRHFGSNRFGGFRSRGFYGYGSGFSGHRARRFRGFGHGAFLRPGASLHRDYPFFGDPVFSK